MNVDLEQVTEKNTLDVDEFKGDKDSSSSGSNSDGSKSKSTSS